MFGNCAKLQIDYKCKGMFLLSIAFCSVSVGRVVAELRGCVHALMVFTRSMHFRTISLWLIYTREK